MSFYACIIYLAFIAMLDIFDFYDVAYIIFFVA